MAYLKITMVGTGNMATQMSLALEDAGHQVREIYGRDIEKASLLASNLYEASATDSLDFSESDVDLIIIAVSDDAIDLISLEIIMPPTAMLVHTSGSKPLAGIANATPNCGVFYPVQTFTVGRKPNWQNIPICIQANDGEGLTMLQELAATLTPLVAILTETQRQTVHLAAVFVNNFGNHLLFLSKNLLDNEGVESEILRPLAEETVFKGYTLGPEDAQTGPAIRRDATTIHRHLQYLNPNPELKQIYQMLSGSIQRNN